MKEKLLDLIADVLWEDDPIAKDKLIELDDLSRIQFTSITFIRFIVEIEDEFGIEFDDTALGIGKFNSIQDLCEYIEKKLQYQ